MDLKRKFQMQEIEDDILTLTENQNDSDSKRAQYLSYTDRYFKKYYKLNVKYENNDHLILVHSNKVAVCAIAPSHPVLDSTKYKIIRVDFIQKVNEAMSGKHKHNANRLNNVQGLCKIIASKVGEHTPETNDESEEETFIIYSCLNAKLVEINEKLLKNPELLQSKAQTDGYLAIMITNLDTWKDQISSLTTHEEYVKYISEKNKA